MRTAVRVTDSKMTARDVFLGKDELPVEGGPNPLRELYEKNYAIEIFYFAASSLEITELTRCGAFALSFFASAFLSVITSRARKRGRTSRTFYCPKITFFAWNKMWQSITKKFSEKGKKI